MPNNPEYAAACAKAEWLSKHDGFEYAIVDRRGSYRVKPSSKLKPTELRDVAVYIGPVPQHD